MSCRALIGIVLGIGLCIPSAERAAETASPAPLGVLKLTDGRVLHNVTLMSDEGENVVLRADEGLLKVAKSNLPQAAFAGAPSRASAPAAPGPELVMQAFNPNPTPNPTEAPDVKKPVPRQVTPVPTRARAVPNPVYKGCTIISFQMKAYQTALGCAEVIVHNDTDAPVLIHPGDFVCVTPAGVRHVGRSIITDGFPPQIKRREIVPPQGEVDDVVTFTADPLENSSVQWAH